MKIFLLTLNLGHCSAADTMLVLAEDMAKALQIASSADRSDSAEEDWIHYSRGTELKNSGIVLYGRDGELVLLGDPSINGELAIEYDPVRMKVSHHYDWPAEDSPIMQSLQVLVNAWPWSGSTFPKSDCFYALKSDVLEKHHSLLREAIQRRADQHNQSLELARPND